MELKIATEFGENRFDLHRSKVMSILNMAFAYANGSKDIKEVTDDEIKVKEAESISGTLDAAGKDFYDDNGENMEKKNEKVMRRTTAVRKERQHSRNDSLFGEGWRNNASSNTEDEQRRFFREKEGYRGFLYIKCPSCGRIKGFCAKENTKEHRCGCGKITPLIDLKPMYTKCECGKEYKYYTNMDEKSFNYQCMNCSSNVDMVLNLRETAYVTNGKNKTEKYQQRY